MDLTAMTDEQCHKRLEALIKERALQFGEFTLASGATSSYYIDGRLVTLHGAGAYCLARCILAILDDYDVQAVGGMALGADPISGATAAVAASRGIELDAFMVRKEPKGYGTGRQVEGPISDGARVAMVEDTVTTGGSTLDAIAAVERERDASVEVVIAMVDRLSGAREAIEGAAYRFMPIFTVEELGVEMD
jgi:orotate phosphoribosyltransferase